MNYTELKTNIQDICENTFTDEQLAMFTKQAEQKIYNAVEIPALRRNSIVTAGTTWLGNEFDSALLNGALVEAIRFMKGEADLVSLYDKMYMQAITLLKNLGDGKLREDVYRSGQTRNKVM